MLSDSLKQYALLNPLRTTYLFLQQVSPAEARGSLDWQCLQTIFEVEKSALETALKEQDWHILRIQKELDSPEGSSIAAGKNLLQEYLESWSEEKQKTLHSLGKAGDLAGELAYSAFLDKKYGETKNYLFLAEEIYQSLKVKDPESKIAEGRLTQLAKVADLIVQ